MAKPDMSMEPKITCYKIFIFQLILEFQKHFHYAEANTGVRTGFFSQGRKHHDQFYALSFVAYYHIQLLHNQLPCMLLDVPSG
jgi:hypothetical protein